MRIRVMPAALIGLSAAVVLGSVTLRSQAAATAAHKGARRSSNPTFTETIAPIVYANCVTCHRPGEVAPFSLITYEDVVKNGKLIARVTESQYMPPWHATHGYGEFVGERGLADAADCDDRHVGEERDAARRRLEDAQAAGVSTGRVAARAAGSDPGDAGSLRSPGERSGRVSQFRDSDEAH